MKANLLKCTVVNRTPACFLTGNFSAKNRGDGNHDFCCIRRGAKHFINRKIVGHSNIEITYQSELHNSAYKIPAPDTGAEREFLIIIIHDI